MYDIYLSKPIAYTTRVNHVVNYELWVIMMCQYRLSFVTNGTTLVKDVDDGGGYACVG